MVSPSSLPPHCHLRPARAQDIWPIRRLVLQALLDPTQLRWSQFWVVEANQQIVACGQLREFEGAQELGSLVVAPAWRGQGLGKALTYQLIHQATQPLYLECLGHKLLQFYTHLGFCPTDWSTLPHGIQRKYRITHLLSHLLPLPLFILYYPASLHRPSVA